MAETTQQAPAGPQLVPEREPRLALRNDEDEIVHVVCCRDDPWEVTFCGEPADSINVNATMVCTLCVEAAKSRRPAWDVFADPPICPNDGERCPDEGEIDLRILREVSP